MIESWEVQRSQNGEITKVIVHHEPISPNIDIAEEPLADDSLLEEEEGGHLADMFEEMKREKGGETR